MSDIRVKADRVSKHFLILRHRETTLRAIKAFLRREAFRKRFQVLYDVSFDIAKGDRVAIIGRNGAGKTTLLRILAGIYSPTSGQVTISSEPKVLFNFWSGINGDLSVVDNIYLRGSFDGVDRDFLINKIHAILTMAELTSLAHTPVKRLSLGQLQKLSMSIFFATPGDFIIFDECLAFVDKGFVQRTDFFLKEYLTPEKTIIMASHDGDFLKRHCKRAIWLDNGHVRMDGDAGRVISEYERSLSEAEPPRTAQ